MNYSSSEDGAVIGGLKKAGDLFLTGAAVTLTGLMVVEGMAAIARATGLIESNKSFGDLTAGALGGIVKSRHFTVEPEHQN